MSLRLRLALFLTAALSVALFAFGAGVQFAVDHFARQAMTRDLAEEAQRLIASGDLRELDRQDPELGAAQLARVELFHPGCSLTRIANRLRRLANIGEVLPVSEAGLHALQHGQPWIEVAALSEFEGDLHMIYSQPIIENRRWVGIAQIARSMSEHHSLLRALRDFLFLGGGLTALGAFGLTWGLAGRALHPLSRMARTIQTMGMQRDFGRRLYAEARMPEEIRRLASALDAALAELQSARRRAERALVAQREALADVSHELRTPLTTVRGNLGLLQRGVPMSDAERHAILRDAIDEVERMSRLVNDLLAFAGAEGNAPRTLPLSAIPIAPLVIEMTRRATAVARGRAIFLDGSLRSADPADSPIVTGNADAIRQVLTILLDNAIKFTPEEGHIVVALNVDGDRAHIHVRDTGAGISLEDQPHIFERFYRAARGEHAPSGYGLGLAIAKSLVEAQGGMIRVASEPGRGSTFTVSLPLAR
ncbi:MAG: HAMP domain-containing sensor histidine kinase [Anaerolineae bacterium]|nr:HAMP domain-containing histidine kinase [Candidatus Roseilinea sp.]MDW8450739.1 HAMP domain-containing sensor histidine kinase [Anaerolineae bacterium]